MFEVATHMDFDGQGRAERFSRFIITFCGIIGLIYGGYVQQFSQTVYCLGGGVAIAALLTVPPWPMYRRKPLNWQKPRKISTTASEGGDEGNNKKKDKKK